MPSAWAKAMRDGDCTWARGGSQGSRRVDPLPARGHHPCKPAPMLLPTDISRLPLTGGPTGLLCAFRSFTFSSIKWVFDAPVLEFRGVVRSVLEPCPGKAVQELTELGVCLPPKPHTFMTPAGPAGPDSPEFRTQVTSRLSGSQGMGFRLLTKERGCYLGHCHPPAPMQLGMLESGLLGSCPV